MKTALLEFSGVSFSHPGRPPILRELDLALAEGERMGLTGANGSGKSTLLHLAVGLLKPQAGEIRYDHLPRSREADFLAVRREVGLLFQNSDDQLFCATVEEDIAFGPFNLGLTRAEVETRVWETLAQLEIPTLAHRITYRLSEGEKRLVALGTLLAMRPRALLLDEPTNGLDDSARARLLDILGRLPVAMLIATHDHALLDALSCRRARLRDGCLHE